MRAELADIIARYFHVLSQRMKWTISLSWIYKLKWLLGGEILDLPVFQNHLNYHGKAIGDEYLSGIFANETFSTWALDVDTLNLLIHLVRKNQPQAILEFGAGVSTICFAYLMKELHPDSKIPRVFSIEQDQDYLDSVDQRLKGLGLENMVRFYRAPIAQQVIESVTAVYYQLTAQVLDELLIDVNPDFILVDGPSGKKMARFGTLPLVKKHVACGAHFFMDDSLRNEELNVARRWKNLSYLTLDGVYMLGKGLLTGQINNQNEQIS